MINPLVGMPSGPELLIILAIIILIFGAAKLPALARSMGQSLRIFKAETKGLRDDEDEETQPPELPPAPRTEQPESQGRPEQQPGSSGS